MSLPNSPPPARQSALRSRLADWLARYGPAEVAGTITAVLGSYLVHAATANEVAAAYGGAIGENIGFYGVILLREIRRDVATLQARGEPFCTRHALTRIRKLLLEFGPSELLDSGVMRPLAMGFCTQWLG